MLAATTGRRTHAGSHDRPGVALPPTLGVGTDTDEIYACLCLSLSLSLDLPAPLALAYPRRFFTCVTPAVVHVCGLYVHGSTCAQSV